MYHCDNSAETTDRVHYFLKPPFVIGLAAADAPALTDTRNTPQHHTEVQSVQTDL